jgi:hypothetical protein
MKIMIALIMLCLPLFGQSPIERKDGKEAEKAFEAAIQENIRPELQEQLRPIVAAIRYAENGGAGKEFGILNSKANTYRKQAGWCAATVQKNWDRWMKAGCKEAFIDYLGKIYCPVGAENDPNGLNAHWVKNVRHWYWEFRCE